MTTEAVSSTIVVPQGRGGRMASFVPGAGTTPAFNKGDTPSFSDLIDIVNPLQHIPVVNTLYRAITGDKESAFADVVGGTLYGGPLGAAFAIADLGLRDATGKTVGEHAVAWLGIGGKDDAPKANDTAVAAAAQPAAQVAAATAVPKTLTASSSMKPMASSATPNAAKLAAKADPDAGQDTGPTLAPAALMANETVQPTTKQASLTPAIVPKASPYAASTGGSSDSNGPVTAGDYLVFGGTGAAGQSASAPPEPTAAPLAAVTPVTPKTFATLGANTAPAATLPTTTGAPATAQVASLSGDKPRMFKVPPRNGPATPQATLPPPTTGPGALPGGKSMALSAQDAAVQQDPQHNFLTAYTQALDKYRNAQRLAGQTPTAPVSADAPASLLQPAAAIAPADAASGQDSSVTLH